MKTGDMAMLMPGAAEIGDLRPLMTRSPNNESLRNKTNGIDTKIRSCSDYTAFFEKRSETFTLREGGMDLWPRGARCQGSLGCGVTCSKSARRYGSCSSRYHSLQIHYTS